MNFVEKYFLKCLCVVGLCLALAFALLSCNTGLTNKEEPTTATSHESLLPDTEVEESESSDDLPQSQPVETRPWESEPIETQAVDTQPAGSEPMETEPMETQPMETEPMETQPVETEPMETQPVETEPMETEPTDPGDQEPHKHVYDNYICAPEYLISPATCQMGSEYYLSCVCGQAAVSEGGSMSFFDSDRDLQNHTKTPEDRCDEWSHWSVYSCCGARASDVEYHAWENGICSDCTYECLHEGGEATCVTLAVCYICECEYGELNPDVHCFDEGYESKLPDCVNEGIINFRCLDCGVEKQENIAALGHNYYDWSEYEVATCLREGTGIRACEVCHYIDKIVLPKTGHDFSKVVEAKDSDGNDTVAVICKVCEVFAGEIYQGMYLDNENAFYLDDCANDFSFDVCVDLEEDPDYICGFIKESVVITDLYHTGMDTYDYPEIKIDFSVTPKEGNVYHIAPIVPYSENRTYVVRFGGSVRFADMPGELLMFQILGEEKSEITYNSDIIFLKTLAIQNALPFEYMIEYDEEQELYGLVVADTFCFDQSYIGKLLCIGDCVNMEEADALPSDQVVIGKIEAIYTEYENLMILALSVPSVDEIYSELDISGNDLPQLDESIVTEEFKRAVLDSVLESEDFATAVAASRIAVSNFAMERGYRAESKLDLSIDKFRIEVKVTTTDTETAKIEFKIFFNYASDIMDGDINLGTITFDFLFDMSYTINIDVTSNLDKLFTSEIKKTGLNLDCKVTNTFSAAYDMSFNLDMNYLWEGEAFYVVNKNTEKIHLPECRFCPTKSENLVVVTRNELSLYVNNYQKHGCSVCNPFQMGNGGFIINPHTQTIHCAECIYVDEGLLNSEMVHKHYPIGLGGKDCSVCQPQNYTKTLEKYLEESVADANFGKMFESIRNMMTDKAEGKGESPIDADTKPKVTIPLYCFEIPIYVEPKLDFSLKANFRMHYDFEITNVICVALVKTNDGYRAIGSSKIGKPEQNIGIDMTGEFRVELGLISEIRLGVKYLTKQIYVGVLGEAGMYVDSHGIYHLDTSKDEHYYAARFEIGYYTEVRCTYKVIGIIKADSFDILAKKYSPVFNSGDEKIYNRFTSYEDEMSFENTKIYYLDNLLLGVNYYDLKEKTDKKGYLSWGEKKQYGFECVFKDENGNVVDYIIFDGGALYIQDNAPDKFTVYMTVSVFDKIIAKTFEEYVGQANKGGCSIFLEPKVIKINYNYVDTTQELEAFKGVYKGYYDVGEDLFGTRLYRNALIGIHKISELVLDEELLAFYAKLATFVKVDDNGNPEKIYTVEEAREMLLALPHEYVMISYSEPGNSPFDDLRAMSAAGVFYVNGLATNGQNDYSVESTDSYALYTVITDIIPGDGIYGDVYSDSTMEEYIGAYVIQLVKPEDL